MRRSAWIAERLICWLTSRERAAAAVGDLVELRPEKGAVWFWISVLGILFSLTWRPSLGFVAAVFVGSRLVGAFQTRLVGIHAVHRPPEYPWVPVFLVLSGEGIVLCMVLIYAVIRYGVRDKLSQLVLAWAGLITVVIYEWWRPVVLATCIVLALVVTGISLFTHERRRAFVGMWVPVASVFAAWWPATYLEYRYEQSLHRGPLGDIDLRAHPSILWVDLMVYLLMAWIATAAFSAMRRWSSDKRSMDLQPAGE